jgi:glutaredoxin-dependent peroxiredoxin
MPTLNAPAPSFNLFNTARQGVSLESLKGQTVILAFFPAAFTGVCQKELCTFNDSLSTLNAASATVFGISVDGPFALSAFKTQNDIAFELLSDHARTATNDYGVAVENFAGTGGYTVAQRSVFIVNANGDLAYSWVAPNPGVEPDYQAVIEVATNA